MKYSVINDIDLISKYLSISHEKLANKIGISFETISRIYTGEIEPSNEILEKIYSFIFDNGINLNRIKVDYYQKNHDVVLYHGSKSELVENISLDFSREHVDLGKGFYAGDNYDQSLDFVSQTKEGSIYVLDVDYRNLNVLNIDVSLKWMLFIALNRSKLEKYKDTSLYKQLSKEMNSYDVLIAPIADNRMFTTIDDFVKSAITSEQAIHALKDLSLGKQIVFKTDKAINQIKIIERLYVSKSEKKKAYENKIQKIANADSFISDAYEKYIRQGQYISEVFNDEKNDK